MIRNMDMFKILKEMLLGKKEKESANTDEIGFSKSLEKNISTFKDIFADDDTVIYRKFENINSDCLKCCAIFIDGMVNDDFINESILRPLINMQIKQEVEASQLLDFISSKVITSSDVKEVKDINQAIGSVLYGDTILLVDGFDKVLTIDTKGWEFRKIQDSETEPLVRGPRESFTEAILVNLSLIRRKIKSPDLKFKFKEIGSRTKTITCVCYVEGIANEKIINELMKRLDDIEIDGILESGYIEELIKDSPFSIFNTIGNTDRPDVVAAKMLEGRIAVVVDGTPVVLTLPFLYVEYFQASEDYYDNFVFASLNRVLRWIGFFLSTSVPAIYISLSTFHQEMMPTPLAISISAAREGVPLPTVVEAVLMLIVFAILREAGIRLPKPIGQAISIVGAIVLGESAVTAKLVSAPIVVVVAISGISGFLVPKIIGPSVLLRFIFLIPSAFLGLYGYIFSVIGVTIHLVSMRSFGVPYMYPLGSINKQDLKDVGIRAPWWYMYYRPKLISSKNPVRKPNSKQKRQGNEK
jgi:spore germination protein KA